MNFPPPTKQQKELRQQKPSQKKKKGRKRKVLAMAYRVSVKEGQGRMDVRIQGNEAKDHINAYLEYRRVVGDADGGVLMSQREYNRYKEKVWGGFSIYTNQKAVFQPHSVFCFALLCFALLCFSFSHPCTLGCLFFAARFS